MSLVPTVARFNVTPVKSTALHHPERIRLDERGAAGDRRFFFVDAFGKRFSGATKAPILPIRAAYDEAADRLELRLPNGVVVVGTAELDGEALEVNFYGRPVAAHVVGGDFGEALSAYAGHEVRLARPDRPGDAIDVRPVTLVSLESVAELARRGEHELDDAGARGSKEPSSRWIGDPSSSDQDRCEYRRNGSPTYSNVTSSA